MPNDAPGRCYQCNRWVGSCEGALEKVRYGRGWTLKVICKSCYSGNTGEQYEKYEKARRQMVEAACEAQERFTLDELEECAK